MQRPSLDTPCGANWMVLNNDGVGDVRVRVCIGWRTKQTIDDGAPRPGWQPQCTRTGLPYS
eukprot:scaffold653128_cov83-Prasinocladus_malaysianus.AAC.1